MRRISEYVAWKSYEGVGEDAHGNEGETWMPAVEKGIYAFDPGSSSEPRDGGDRVIVEPTIYMPADVIFAHRDKVSVRGQSYDVEGETREWRHPNGRRKGNVVSLRRGDG